jgi:hypothetical protein
VGGADCHLWGVCSVSLCIRVDAGRDFAGDGCQQDFEPDSFSGCEKSSSLGGGAGDGNVDRCVVEKAGVGAGEVEGASQSTEQPSPSPSRSPRRGIKELDSRPKRE